MPDQKKSALLTEDENDTVIELLGYKCQTLATTVIELYTTLGPSSGEWSYKETGVLCLVKDHNKRSYFFRLYCPLRKILLWEHEVYNDIQYLAPTPFLHTFEAENCIAGFNFASENEGGSLRQVLEETLKAKNQKKVERRNRYNSQVSKPLSEVNGGTNLTSFNNFNVNNVVQLPLSRPTGKHGRKKGISKADIGEPHDFRHVSHVGWDPNKGFDLDKVDDPQLKAFFNQAGVSETHLRDKETREFIYDFIVRNGGIEAVKEEMDPPPIPHRIKTAPPRPPTRTLGPPPPPPRIQPPRTMPIGGPVKQDEGPVSESVKETAAYPPPPPPPPPPGPPPPPLNLPDLTPSTKVASNPGAALMQELTNNRKQLKLDRYTPMKFSIKLGVEDSLVHTFQPLNLDKESEDRKLPPQMATDSHFQLMDQIKEGIKLKPVTASTNQGPTVTSGGLASALAKALAERSKVIYSDSSSTDDSDEADDEWD